MRTLTDEKREQYLSSRWGSCPFCGSKNITAGQHDFEGREVYSAVTCDDCNAEWTDIYTLTGIDPA